ncbi:phosphonate ABC transporter, permease protein PhnE [Alkalihalobacillus sp. AL-G]|uniref:phosphonate ABC transporter, permease protein PhnE n=1 Tax=Alkalihalobacillus sp. AL-G TaxID=2926399 RepID=UPI00272BE9DA|nr:phosphonate ABC transporter, permease protein PhnE [Alkalihalobacillus sp. AL-G]WLD95339.1 phosphonate ABC transporter, permease protein PhnE [Alkalihalobacillus sp. AL-G]
MNTALPPKPQKNPLKIIRNYGFGLGFLALFIWSFATLPIPWGRIFSQRTIDNIDRVIPKLLNPDFTFAEKVLNYMMETLFIAFAGSFMAAILAVPFGFLAAANINRNPFFNTLGKWILNADRTFPEILLALIFVVAIGPGAFAGVLAIAIHSIGMLGKLYSEVIESIDMNVVEAMEANGANKIQIFFYGIMPQVIPEFMSYAIYRFEIDVRASTILGIIGAGGIGTLLVISSRNRNWDEVGMILLVIIIFVSVIDYFSSAVRKRIV